MSSTPRPKRILLVTGMSGAGKSTVMKSLEDMGWEAVENLPLGLLDRLLAAPQALGAQEDDRPLALGIDSRTRGFDADRIIMRIKQLRELHGHDVETLFLDCGGGELERRFSETRRRHPMAQDRPVADGIAEERDLMDPLRHWAEHVIDTTETQTNELQQQVRARFGGMRPEEPTVTVMSFGYARGLPRSADLVFDMRFLRNPHWEPSLRPLTGQDPGVGAHIAQDPAYETALRQIETLLLTLLPRYALEGKSYLTIAIGCTGGRHRSVHVAERVAARLRDDGFSLTVAHRDLATIALDAIEDAPEFDVKSSNTGLSR
jgi:RNase adapter protein RapZ